MSRTAAVERSTKETKIRVELGLDGTGNVIVDTGMPFFDHMLQQLGKHAGFDLQMTCAGDLHVDGHHTVEDCGIAVVRTFSKAFALAGARIGYVLASPDVVHDLRRVRLPYHLSSLTQTAGIIALRHRHEASGLLGAIRVQRDRIVRELRMLGLEVFPTDANFVLFVVPEPLQIDATSVWQALLDRDVLIRDMTAVVPRALRVTAGTEHETDRFLSAIKEVLTG